MSREHREPPDCNLCHSMGIHCNALGLPGGRYTRKKVYELLDIKPDILGPIESCTLYNNEDWRKAVIASELQVRMQSKASQTVSAAERFLRKIPVLS